MTDAHGDEEQGWAFLQAFTDNVKTLCAATVASQSIRVTKFDYDGNDRLGLTAKSGGRTAPTTAWRRLTSFLRMPNTSDT